MINLIYGPLQDKYSPSVGANGFHTANQYIIERDHHAAAGLVLMQYKQRPQTQNTMRAHANKQESRASEYYLSAAAESDSSWGCAGPKK